MFRHSKKLEHWKSRIDDFINHAKTSTVWVSQPVFEVFLDHVPAGRRDFYDKQKEIPYREAVIKPLPSSRPVAHTG